MSRNVSIAPPVTLTRQALATIQAQLAAIGAAPTARAVYLLHLEQPYPAGRRLQHYLGSAKHLQGRLLDHWTGGAKASPLIRAAIKAAITVQVVRTWPGGPDLERQLKRRRRHRDECPHCRAQPIA